MFEADLRQLPTYETGMGIRSFSLRRLIFAVIMLWVIATLTFVGFVAVTADTAWFLIFNY